jgi:hypothetical protein
MFNKESTFNENYTSTVDGYKAHDYLVGYRSFNGTNVYRDGNTYIQRRGLYGECQDGLNIKFLEDQDIQECGFPQKVMTEDLCMTTLSTQKLIGMFFSTNGENTTSYVSPILGASRKFGLYGNYSEIFFNETGFLNTTYNSTTCECDNFVLEAYYTVYF